MSFGKRIIGHAAAMLLASTAALAVSNGSFEADRLTHAEREPQNWLTYNGTYDEQRFSPLNQINETTVGRLGLAWSYDIDTPRGQESTPLVVDGTMYITTAWSKVVALDAGTGAEKWRYDPQVPGAAGLHACCDVVNRGAAYNDGKVFVGTIDGRLIALDAVSGKPIWSVQTTDPAKAYTITGAPRVVRGKVLIGNGGAEYGVRGYVTAYDERTGRLVWRFYTVPGEPDHPDGSASDGPLERIARPTWFGDRYWRYGGGGTVWDSIVYDRELNRLYIGVGNGGPWNRKIRSEDKGDNLFLGSIVALDPDTGHYIWHYQETPGDTWDYTSSQQITLATLPIDGKPRKVILHAPKNGFFYVIDRESGKLISAEKFAAVNWADRVDIATGRPVENPDARFQAKPFLSTSGASGAHNWQPMSFDPQNRLVYIPAQQIPFLYVKDTGFVYRPDLWNLGVDMMSTPLPQTPKEIAAMKQALNGSLLAWDPVKRKPAWVVAHDGTWNGGVMATAGGLVFQGLADATFRAYRASDGKELWRFASQSPILPGPMSYWIGDTQYVAIVAGAGGGFALALPSFVGPRAVPPGRVLVFRLGGEKRLPPIVGTPPPLNVMQQTFPPPLVAQGAHLFGQICAACHGQGTLSAGIVPDLKRSGALASADAWKQIVIDGVLRDQGMASFAKYLTPAQAEAIRAYVATEAQRAAARQHGGA